MKRRKLKKAPSFHCQDMMKVIDELCRDQFMAYPEKVRQARMYFYRTRLNMAPNQVAAILGMDPREVNHIVKQIGGKRPQEMIHLEERIKERMYRYILRRYRKHPQQVIHRVRKTGNAV